MRIITGEYRGRKLQTPRNYDVRPTTDKVKEAIFNLLIPYLREDIVVLDLFSGTGNLGLEALSRCAKKCYFSDSSRESIRLIKENIKACNAEDKSVVLAGDYRQNINRVYDKLDIVFLDPPYAENYYLTALSELKKTGKLNEGACIVCEHAEKNELPDEYEGFKKVKDKKYGSIGVSIYE